MSDWLNNFWLAGSKGGSSKGTRYPQDDPEGATGMYDSNGNLIKTGAVSITRIEVLDLIGEGEIEGLISGSYQYTGYLGQIGYSGYEFKPFQVAQGTTNTNYLRSIYWNEVPLVDSSSPPLYNFSNIDLSYTPGYANGSLLNSTKPELTVTKAYGERLRAAYSNPDTDAAVATSNSDYAKTYRILNKDCRGVIVNIKFGQLIKRNIFVPTSKSDVDKSGHGYGDVERTEVDWQVEYRPLFSDNRESSFSVPVQDKVAGKITYGFIKSTRVDFIQGDFTEISSVNVVYDKKFLGWEIKITRLTPDSTSSTLVNQTFIDSVTQLYGDRFMYPNSAVVRSKFNAEYFSQIPNRAFDTKLLKVKIPSNYDPIRKFYNGTWDGTFTTDKQWTDNPAWCFYDLLTSNRYGLGKYISNSQVDKWTLYKIGQYCDEMVQDGFGGVEPRFTCNILINSKEEAFKLLNDFASVFRGILYYANSSIFLGQDAVQDLSQVLMQFTNANVKEGNFNYTTSPRNTIATVAVVRYNDSNNFYKPAIEYIEDVEAIKKYGVRELELTALGCTSRGQAIRLGKWALYTENNEYESISFTAGTEGALIRPGDVVKVYDGFRNYDRLGGRVNTFVSNTIVELDANISGVIASGLLTGNFYNLTLTTPRHNYDISNVNGLDSTDISQIRNYHVQTQRFTGIGATGVVSGKSRINLTGSWNFSGFPNSGSQTVNPVWTIDLFSGVPLQNNNVAEYWRVINVKEDQINEYSILGIKYNTAKYSYIDSGVAVSNTIVNQANGLPTSPQSLLVNIQTQGSIIHQKVIDYQYTVPNFDNIADFKVYTKYGSDILDSELDSIVPQIWSPDILQGSYPVTSTGYYYFRVYSENSMGVKSVSYASNRTGLLGYDVLNEVSIGGLLLEDQRTGTDIPVDETPDTRDTGYYTEASPLFGWDVFPNNPVNYDASSLLYRVTIREPSNTNNPSPVYYAQYTGISAGNKLLDVTYRFDIDANSAIVPPLPNFPHGPYREYDVVVEAHNKEGVSSAGGNFTSDINASGLFDSSYTNGNGFDILYVNNPPINGVWLALGADPADSLASGDFHDAYSINSNGSITINLLTGRALFPDALGGYLYYHTGAFSAQQALSFPVYTQANASGFVPFSIPEGGINQYPYSLNINTSLDSSVSSKNIAFSLFNSFDQGINAETYNRTGLTLSNVRPIYRYSDLTLTGASGALQTQINSLVATDISLQSQITNNYTTLVNLVATASGSLKTDITATGVILGGQINSLSGYANNTFATIVNLATTNTNLQTTGSTLNSRITSLSGYATGTFATIGDLAATGSTLNSKTNSLSGYANNTFATIINLATTGSILDTRITSLSGYANNTFATISNLASTGSTLNSKINTLSGYADSTFATVSYVNNTFATITNLTTTGATLYSMINSLSGYSTSNFATLTYVNGTFATIVNLASTGSALSSRIDSLSGYANTSFYLKSNPQQYVTSGNLYLTGHILDDKINSFSGYANNTFYLNSNPSGFITGCSCSGSGL